MTIKEKVRPKFHQDASYAVSVTELANKLGLKVQPDPAPGIDLLLSSEVASMAFRFDSGKWAFSPYQIGQMMQGIEQLNKQSLKRPLETLLVTLKTPESYLAQAFATANIKIVHNASMTVVLNEIQQAVTKLSIPGIKGALEHELG